LIDISGIRELWIKGHYRALIMPTKEDNTVIVSLDIFSQKWKFKIEDETRINDIKLVYARFKPEEIGLNNTVNSIERVEIVGAIGSNFTQTISARIWIKVLKSEVLEEDLKLIHEKLMKLIS